MDVTYKKCSDLSDAIQLLKNNDHIIPYAGCTDVMVGIRGGKFKPKGLLNVSEIEELKVLKEDEKGITIGAAVCLNDIISYKPVILNVPALSQACHSIGTYSVRNRGTLVGNICNASPAADTAPVLLCLNTLINVIGSEGERVIPIDKFFISPGRTALRMGELVVSVLIPKPFPEGKGIYKKASRTNSVDLATVGVSVQKWNKQVMIGLGAVAPTPVRAKFVEKAINQDGIVNWSEAAGLVKHDISPISDIRGSREYRHHITEVLVRRGLEQIMGGESV